MKGAKMFRKNSSHAPRTKNAIASETNCPSTTLRSVRLSAVASSPCLMREMSRKHEAAVRTTTRPKLVRIVERYGAAVSEGA
eukprot:2268377-Prymnesium_polylepis.1